MFFNRFFLFVWNSFTGKGNFGEIFLASDNIRIPVTNENAKFVVKIEPHSNGPLFVEIHCLMNTAKKEKCKYRSIKKKLLCMYL